MSTGAGGDPVETIRDGRRRSQPRTGHPSLLDTAMDPEPAQVVIDHLIMPVAPLAYVRLMDTGMEFQLVTAQPAPQRSQPDRPTRTPTEGYANPHAVGRPLGHHGPQWGDVIAEWSCPVCGTRCNRTYRSGRGRVYCTNACRQRAYRWRRTRRAGCRVAPAPERASTRDRSHALRSAGDLVAGRRDSTGRQITACGAFGRAARDRPSSSWHTDFVADTPWSCRTCAAVLGVESIPVETMLERALAHAAARRDVR